MHTFYFSLIYFSLITNHRDERRQYKNKPKPKAPKKDSEPTEQSNRIENQCDSDYDYDSGGNNDDFFSAESQRCV